MIRLKFSYKRGNFMDISKCKLYNLKRKKDLYRVLGIINKLDISNNINKYKPYIEEGAKKRLIEPTLNKNSKLALIQKRINKFLQMIEYNDYVFSGVKGKSYIANGRYHLGCKELVAIDISKFYPNIHREKAYKFFKNILNCSSDVSNILTNLVTIDLTKIENVDKDVFEYIQEKDIKTLNHLPTGVATSALLSYLVNIQMFEKIRLFCISNNYKMSVYIDDIVISSSKKIHNKNINKIINIIEKNNYSISKSKLKHYKENEFKRVTGSIISKNGTKLVLPNKIKRKKIIIKADSNLSNICKANKIRGLDQINKQIEKIKDNN